VKTTYIVIISFIFVGYHLFKGGGAEGFTGIPGSHIVSSAETCSE
jgi:hypothetical protein